MQAAMEAEYAALRASPTSREVQLRIEHLEADARLLRTPAEADLHAKRQQGLGR